VKLYEPLLLGEFTVAAVPAVDGLNDDQVSWVILADGQRLFHGGDTLWHGAWWQIARQYGPFDWVFLPINGVQLPFLQPASEQPVTMTPEQAVAAGIVLGAKLTIPIHYGLPATDSYFEVPTAEKIFIETAKQRKLSIKIVQPGDWATE
jgi:L-ascorbate metabolism protein UlaG (beta-lactamase superfamily)